VSDLNAALGHDLDQVSIGEAVAYVQRTHSSITSASNTRLLIYGVPRNRLGHARLLSGATITISGRGCTRATQMVPANPDHPDFRLGKTLGAQYTNWRRVKKGMPDRYRLFFRFASKPIKLIVYVWFNDDDTLRKAGSKTDVYEVFKRMLSRGQVPTSINDLVAESSP
jgi:hypothetical protein